MTDMITVEPARELRSAFAIWAIAQRPPLKTSSATGFDVPAFLYPSIPPELLAGAYVDGFRLDVSMPQPVAAEPPQAPSGAATGEAPDPTPVTLTAETQLTAETAAKKPPRKRAARRRTASEGTPKA